MTLIEKIPELTDEEVSNLLDNARRLEQAGTPKQQEAATAILPSLEEAFQARRAAKLEAAAAKRAAAMAARKQKAA
jgi:hypothetical protein